MLPWGDKVDLRRSDTRLDQFETLVPLPANGVGADPVVTYILTDKAHNRTQVTVDLSDKA